METTKSASESSPDSNSQKKKRNGLVHTFMDVSFEGRRELNGRIVFELYKDVVPITVENFRSLCTGERSTEKKRLNYESSQFHRILENQLVQGGDITKGIKTILGGECIYGRSFDDENFLLKHSHPGVLSMANTGPGTNCTQFFITLDKLPHLDGKHVAFGRVISGMNIVRNIAKQPVDSNNKPLKQIIIHHCGEVKLVEDDKEELAERERKLKEESDKRQKEIEEEIKKESEQVQENVIDAVHAGLKRRQQEKDEKKKTKKKRNFMSYGDPLVDDLLDDDSDE